MDKKNKEETKKSSSVNLLLIIVAALAIILSLVSLYRTSSFYKIETNEPVVVEDISYKVYIGLTDKNQKRQIIDENVAMEIIKTICVNHNTSYTIYNANGGYKEEGVLRTEKTIVLEMNRTIDETLNKILNDIKRRLNTEAVMVLKQNVDIYDY